MPMLGKLSLLNRMLALLIVVSAVGYPQPTVLLLALMGLLVAVVVVVVMAVVVGVWLIAYSKFANRKYLLHKMCTTKT